jgi:hypothetical protein
MDKGRLSEVLKTANVHLLRLEKAKEEINSLGDLEKLDLTEWETLKTIDTFVFRFIKLQDYLGNKVFKEFLKAIGEYTEGMSFIDVLDKLEKLGIVDNAEDWLKIRELRNRLTHEYPEEETKRDLKLALKYSNLLKQTLANIESYLLQRRLIDQPPQFSSPKTPPAG